LKKLMLLIAMLAVVLTLVLPAGAQVNDSGNNNEVNCAIVQEQVDALENAITLTLTDNTESEIQILISILNELQQLAEQECGVFIDDNDTINEGDTNEGDTTITRGDQEFEQDFDSGDLEQPTDISVTGDNSAVCTPVQPTGNTGNGGSEQGLQPLVSGLGDTDLDGNAMEFALEMTTDCAPAVNQDAANQLG
jgi:hypothetical protein